MTDIAYRPPQLLRPHRFNYQFKPFPLFIQPGAAQPLAGTRALSGLRRNGFFSRPRSGKLASQDIGIGQEPFARRTFGQDIGAVDLLVLRYEIPYLDRFGAGERPGTLGAEGALPGQDIDRLLLGKVIGDVAGDGIGEGRHVITFGRHRRSGDPAGPDQRLQFPGDIHLQLAPALRDDLQRFPRLTVSYPAHSRRKLRRIEVQAAFDHLLHFFRCRFHDRRGVVIDIGGMDAAVIVVTAREDDPGQLGGRLVVPAGMETGGQPEMPGLFGGQGV